MEETLKNLIRRIESAAIPESDKIHLYLEIRYALQAAVTPVIVSHLPKEQVQALVKNLSSVTLDGYITLLSTAIHKEGVLEEIEESMREVLDEIGKALTESGV
ncbi:MAG: hypothetical protein ACOY3M_05565 [Patescibacteria group bacterium]